MHLATLSAVPIKRPIQLATHGSIYLPIYQSIYLSVYLIFIYLSILRVCVEREREREGDRGKDRKTQRGRGFCFIEVILPGRVRFRHLGDRKTAVSPAGQPPWFPSHSCRRYDRPQRVFHGSKSTCLVAWPNRDLF